MKTLNKYVGMDVHKDTTVVAVAEGNRLGEVRCTGRSRAICTRSKRWR